MRGSLLEIRHSLYHYFLKRRRWGTGWQAWLLRGIVRYFCEEVDLRDTEAGKGG